LTRKKKLECTDKGIQVHKSAKQCGRELLPKVSAECSKGFRRLFEQRAGQSNLKTSLQKEVSQD
jgi:hypothetical protein